MSLQFNRRGDGEPLSFSLRYLLFFLIAAASLVCIWMLYQSFFLTKQDKVYGAFYGGMTAALATALGALPVFFTAQYSRKTYAVLLGFGE